MSKHIESIIVDESENPYEKKTTLQKMSSVIHSITDSNWTIGVYMLGCVLTSFVGTIKYAEKHNEPIRDAGRAEKIRQADSLFKADGFLVVNKTPAKQVLSSGEDVSTITFQDKKNETKIILRDQAESITADLYDENYRIPYSHGYGALCIAGTLVLIGVGRGIRYGAEELDDHIQSAQRQKSAEWQYRNSN